MAYDAYVHCGLSKYEPIEVVASAHARLGIDAGVLVQHFGELDNGYIIEAARSTRSRYRVVVLLDPSASGYVASIAAMAADPVVRGVRVAVNDDGAWIAPARAAAEHGLNVLFYFRNGCDGFERPVHELAEAHPDVTFVVSHLGGSSLTFPGTSAAMWADADNVVVQVSGLSMWPDVPHGQLVSTVAELVTSFTASRSLWGSNFPVSPMEQELDFVAGNPCGLSPADQVRLLSTTAISVWGGR